MFLPVPHYRQGKAWSCGPACVRMILAFYGETVSEAELVEALGANERDGTHPRSIVAHMRLRGLRIRQIGDSGMHGLALEAGRSRPVIVGYQDWSGCRRPDYSTSWDHGHYAIVIGHKDDRIWLCDPSSKRKRRSLAAEDFLSRWRDIDSAGRIYRQWGLSVGPRVTRS